jgi:hypothetical protein
VRGRAPGTATARPPAADDVTVPPQDRAGSDDQPHRCEALDRQRPGEQRQPCPVRPRQGRVLAGNPVTSSMVLPSGGKVGYGIWQIAPGAAVEVAPAGMFVVVSGCATIAVDGSPAFDVGRAMSASGTGARAHHLDRARSAPQGLPDHPELTPRRRRAAPEAAAPGWTPTRVRRSSAGRGACHAEGTAQGAPLATQVADR